MPVYVTNVRVLMRTARLRSTLLASGMAAVLALPYTAPPVCGVLGRMDSEMEMSADGGDTAVQAPGTDGVCCTLNQCGIPQIAPLVYAFTVLRQLSAVRVELPAPPSLLRPYALLPPRPPPRA
jgi:hypothetical protein